MVWSLETGWLTIQFVKNCAHDLQISEVLLVPNSLNQRKI